MCQAKPGPRCYADSSKRLKTLSARVSKAEQKLDAARTAMTEAGRREDFAAYAKAKKAAETAEKAVAPLRAELRHTQRDVDSTKTGRRHLDEKIQSATSKTELTALENRKAAGEILYAWRENALSHAQDGYQPVIRLKVA